MLGSNLSSQGYETSNNVHSRIIGVGITYDNFDTYYDNSLTFTAIVEIWNTDQNKANLIYASNCNPVLNAFSTSINGSIEIVQITTCLETVHTVEYLSGITQFSAIAEIHFSDYSANLAPDSSYRITYPVNGGFEFGVHMDIINGTSFVSFDTMEINWGESESIYSITKTTGVNTFQEAETLLITYTPSFPLFFTFLSLITIRKSKK